MKIELNPFKLFQRKAGAATAAPVAAAVPLSVTGVFDGFTAHPSQVVLLETKTVRSTETEETTTMANEFVTVLEKIGSIFEKGLAEAVKYLPLASTIAGFIFPPSVAPLAAANTVADLLQNAIAEAEQKLAAQGNQTGSGATKLATVLTIVTSSVTGLLSDATVSAELKKAGITVNTAYITNLVNAVVSFLNVQGVVATA